MKNFLNKIFSADNTSKGFSLVELIVVIVILAILVGVTIGGVYQYVNQARKNTDISNAETIQSVLSTISTNDTIYKTLGKSGKTCVLSWTTAHDTIPACDISGTDITPIISAILTDGLPASQTGDGFELTLTGGTDGTTTVKCEFKDGAPITEAATLAWDIH